jgi:hypothetical protein
MAVFFIAVKLADLHVDVLPAALGAPGHDPDHISGLPPGPNAGLRSLKAITDTPDPAAYIYLQRYLVEGLTTGSAQG